MFKDTLLPREQQSLYSGFWVVKALCFTSLILHKMRQETRHFLIVGRDFRVQMKTRTTYAAPFLPWGKMLGHFIYFLALGHTFSP